MPCAIDFSDVKVERLSEEHDTSRFDCGDEDINDFLRKDALIWQKARIAITRVFTYQGDIIGFYCASADSLRLNQEEKDNEKTINKKRIRELPAVKIGRLGRSVNYKQCYLGKFILEWAIGHIINISKEIGVIYVTVDAYPRRVGWYEKSGFVKNLHKNYSRKEDNVSMRYCLYNLEGIKYKEKNIKESFQSRFT